MRTFLVPPLMGESMTAYQQRVSGLAWQFNGERALTVLEIGAVMLDGDQPQGAGFVEVTGNVG